MCRRLQVGYVGGGVIDVNISFGWAHITYHFAFRFSKTLSVRTFYLERFILVGSLDKMYFCLAGAQFEYDYEVR